jgi:hypothetical protein
MRRRCGFGGRISIATAIAGLLVAVPASAAVTGPVYPLPGGAATGHGGNQCAALTGLDGAMGKSSGQRWSFGGDNDTTPAAGCPVGAAPTTPFDTTRFDALYWGASSAPSLALDGLIDNTAGTIENMTLSTTPADLAAGNVVWAGTTKMTFCIPTPTCNFTTIGVNTRFTLTIKDPANADAPVPLIDPATVGIPASAGGVVAITPSLTRFTATMLFTADDPITGPVTYVPALDMFNSYNHPNPPPNPFNTQMGFGGGFWYDNRAPIAAFSFPTPATGPSVPVAFTSTSSDPDGAAAPTESWDLDGDNVFGDATGSTANGTYPPGAHTVRLQVTDDEGETNVAEQTFTITDTPAGGGGDPGGGGGDPGGGGGAGPVGGNPDTKAPTASLVPAVQKLKDALKKGIGAKLTADEAVHSSLQLTMPKAPKLGIKNPVGTAAPSLGAAGNTDFTIALSGKAKKKLKKQKKATFALGGTVTDTAGNSTQVTATFTLKK